MVKFIIIFFSLIFFGCEMNSKQIIKPEKFTYDVVKFNSVSKALNNEFKNISSDHEMISDIITYWFENRIKTDGFEGELLVNVKNISFDRVKNRDFYKFSVSLSLEFIEQRFDSQKKQYLVNSKEYGEIKGSFSIKDQDNLDLNLMHQSLESISTKLLEIN